MGIVRAVVNSPMKCGSTFVSRVLARYLGIPDYKPFWGWGWQDHMLSEDLLMRAPPSFVLQAHLKPTRPNVTSAKRNDLELVCLWRNIGDIVISLVDHLCNEQVEQPILYVPDRRWIISQTQEARQLAVIQSVVPWCLAYRRGWGRILQGQGGHFFRYEGMAENYEQFFTSVIRSIGLGEFDGGRLAEALASIEEQGLRLNVGRYGRSAELLSPANKDQIVDLIQQYEPSSANTLIKELPWMR